jgi:hypothetical protein
MQVLLSFLIDIWKLIPTSDSLSVLFEFAALRAKDAVPPIQIGMNGSTNKASANG